MNLIIPGVPLSQTRMRFSARNGFARVYDPMEKHKKHLRQVIASQFGDHPKFIHPRIGFVFHMPIPSSIPKKQLSLYQSGTLKHEKKIDVDNAIKLVLDCMDGIVFDGDQRVMLMSSLKLYHPHPKTVILLQESTQQVKQHEVDPVVWSYLFGSESDKCSFCPKVDPLCCDNLRGSSMPQCVYMNAPHQSAYTSD